MSDWAICRAGKSFLEAAIFKARKKSRTEFDASKTVKIVASMTNILGISIMHPIVPPQKARVAVLVIKMKAIVKI